MNKRLVDANELKEITVDALDALKEILGEHNKSTIDAVIHAVCKSIDSAETVDPVKQGKWLSNKAGSGVNFVFAYECSVCGQKQDIRTAHCSGCGTKMGDE